MKHEQSLQFKSKQPPAGPPSMMEALEAARSAASEMTGQVIDSVAGCRRDENQVWHVSVDVVESIARMGDNDLLATYDIELGPQLELQGYVRRRRYHREDMDA